MTHTAGTSQWVSEGSAGERRCAGPAGVRPDPPGRAAPPLGLAVPDFWVELERLVYYVRFPVLLVRTTLAADLAAAGAGAVLLTAVGATLAGALPGAVVRWFPSIDRMSTSSGRQTALRSNSFIAPASVDDRGFAAVALMGLLLRINVPQQSRRQR